MTTIKPKERGIILDAAEVRGIIEGRRSQLRRAIKPQPPAHIDELHGFEFRKRAPYDIEHLETGAVVGYGFQSSEDDFCKCPYGRPGDRLWVRETWATDERGEEMADGVVYRADGEFKAIDNTPESADLWVTAHDGGKHKGWRSPATMPRWASRVTLEITAVRVEQLQDITEADCWLEGIEEVMHDFDDQSQYLMAKRLGCCIEDAKPLFAQLWESKNGEGSWDDNPWVWVIEFQRIESQ